MQDIEGWLEQHQQDGTLKAEGEFTLNPGEAIRKLAHFGLKSREQGLLRLIQFAIRGRCGSVFIYIERDKVRLEFPRVDQEILDLQNLGVDLSLEKNNFPLALIACLQSGFSEGLVQQGEVLWRFDQTGFQKTSVPDERLDGLLVEFSCLSEGGFWTQVARFLRMRCLQVSELSGLLSCSPVPVKIDGRDPGDDSRAEELLCELVLTAPIYHLGRAVKLLRPHLQYSNIASTFKARVQDADIEFFCDDRQALNQQMSGTVHLAHLWIALDDSRLPTLKFVRDGVIIEEMVLIHKNFKVGGLLSAHGLDTDLSGLKLVDNEKLKALWGYILGELDKLMDDIEKETNLPLEIKKALEKRSKE